MTTTRALIWAIMPSGVGDLLLTTDGDHLTGVFFRPHKSSHQEWDHCRRTGLEDPQASLLARTRTQLEEYFGDGRTEFDLPLAPTGTEFQQRVWGVLTDIPYGRTESYGHVAQ